MCFFPEGLAVFLSFFSSSFSFSPPVVYVSVSCSAGWGRRGLGLAVGVVVSYVHKLLDLALLHALLELAHLALGKLSVEEIIRQPWPFSSLPYGPNSRSPCSCAVRSVLLRSSSELLSSTAAAVALPSLCNGGKGGGSGDSPVHVCVCCELCDEPKCLCICSD